MHVFLTGASGYVGGVIAEHLLAAGHQVTALARSEAAAATVSSLGAAVRRGDLTDLNGLQEAASRADAVVHTAVDYADQAVQDAESAALKAMLEGLGRGRPFVYTSTGLVYPATSPAPFDEETPLDPDATPQPWKVRGERQVLDEPTVAGVVVRAALVHGRGGSALPQGLIAAARANGAATYIAAGDNRWSTVHVDDLARLYVHIIDQPPAGKAVNAAAPAPTSMREIAEAVAQVTATRAVSITLQQALAAIGPFAHQLTTDQVLDPSRAERLLGWRTTEPGLIQDLTAGSYVAR
ncbi:hypothetical protein ACTI_66770 [Actinoplanes sp. OR16]|uniref:NAD-dependent epimerase/dehydratase family protein n=1 Tax=Actinoplanes sp. OR16 TaxID=946334 RepID=UPI000F6FC138|nr:NAD-dependent epimerase/dehydratase family protein [Actinoplanes sp. OR16]BBH69992.1 hypothetical protein ACTI_66770 [Actinoplanes sp. OR16]